MPKQMAQAERLAVTPSIEITFDVAAYAKAYGLEESEVWNDAAEHLVSVAAGAVEEAVQRLGVGASVGHVGTRVNVAVYR